MNVWLTSNNIFSQLQFEQWKLLFNKELYEKRDQSQFQESPITLKESLYKHFNRDTTQKPQMELLLSLKTRNNLMPSTKHILIFDLSFKPTTVFLVPYIHDQVLASP